LRCQCAVFKTQSRTGIPPPPRLLRKIGNSKARMKINFIGHREVPTRTGPRVAQSQSSFRTTRLVITSELPTILPELPTSPFLGTDPESRDSNPAGSGPSFHRPRKARDVVQPSSVIRSALQDQAPPVALQPLLLPSNIENRLRRLHTTPHCVGSSQVSHG